MTVSVETILTSYLTRSIFQTYFLVIKCPSGSFFASSAMLHHSIPKNCSSDPRRLGECLDTLTIRVEMCKDLADGYFTQTIKVHFLSSFEVTSGTSGEAFIEIACMHGIDFTGVLIGTALTGMPSLEFLSALETWSAQAKKFSCQIWRRTELLTLNARRVGRSFSEVVLLLLIWLQTPCPLPIARCSNWRPAEPRFLRTMDCLHPAKNSVTSLSTPRLMTSQNLCPFPLTEPICISKPYRPYCHEIFASWMGPKMVSSPNTPFAAAARSSRMAEYARQLVVILRFSRKFTGRNFSCSLAFEHASR